MFAHYPLICVAFSIVYAHNLLCQMIADHRLKGLDAVQFGTPRDVLVDSAPELIDQYEKIIRSSESSNLHVSRLYRVIALANVNRNMFLSIALEHLKHNSDTVRVAAAQFIGDVGSVSDVAPLLILLSDADYGVAFVAAASIGKLGDDRTVIALDLWLRFYRRPTDWPIKHPTLDQAVTKSRDEIKARLAAAKPAPPKP